MGSARNPSVSESTSVTAGLGELVQDEADDGSSGRVVERVRQRGITVAGEDALHDSGERRPVRVCRERTPHPCSTSPPTGATLTLRVVLDDRSPDATRHHSERDGRGGYDRQYVGLIWHTDPVCTAAAQRRDRLSVTRRVLGALGIATILAIGVGACDSSTSDQAAGVHLSSAPAIPSTAASATAPPMTWTMPNLVGFRLQAAQDRIQSLTNDAITITTSHDATGAGRHQIFDRNWKVCAQNISPGSTINRDTRIDFGAVKLAERCP